MQKTPPGDSSWRWLLAFSSSPELPRALSLELYVLPSSGGHDSEGENEALIMLAAGPLKGSLAAMELTGIEPVTSAVRLQRSPS